MVAPPRVGRYDRTFSTSSDARAAASAGSRNLSHSELARTGPVVMPPPPTPDPSRAVTSPSSRPDASNARRTSVLMDTPNVPDRQLHSHGVRHEAGLARRLRPGLAASQ